MGDNYAARLRMEQFFAHTLQSPAKSYVLARVLKVHDRRQKVEQHNSLHRCKRIMRSHDQALSSFAVRCDRSALHCLNFGACSKGTVLPSSKAKRPSARQQKTFTSPEMHEIGNTINRKPSLPGNNRVAFETVMPREVNCRSSRPDPDRRNCRCEDSTE